jgi:hypothetical protein
MLSKVDRYGAMLSKVDRYGVMLSKVDRYGVMLSKVDKYRVMLSKVDRYVYGVMMGSFIHIFGYIVERLAGTEVIIR